jgi:REase_DpnII-MboI
MGPGCNAWAHRKNTVVSVSDTSDLLLADAHSVLQRALTHRPQADPAILFAYCILKRAADEPEAKQIVTRVAQRTGAQLDFQTVATLGFARESGLLGPDASGTLRQGLERLAGRRPFVDEIPMAFCSDAVGILGVAIGTRSLADDAVSVKIVSWLASFLKTIYDLDGTENWQRCLFQAADRVVGGGIGIPSSMLDQAEDVYVALVAKGILASANDKTAEQEEQQALKLILLQATSQISYERAAIRLAALEYVVRSAPALVPGRISAENLVHLLERVPAGLRKWAWESLPRTTNGTARQWHVDNEYHVQDLLWLLLAPIFPDLDDEQYLTKIGQKNPRADLYIPSMKLIVEVKFLRAEDRMQKIIDEIASDASLYNAMGNDCAGIIGFIWDDSARSHEHDYLRQGLRKLPGIIDAVVISRPSNWTKELQKSAKTSTKAPKSAGKS